MTTEIHNGVSHRVPNDQRGYQAPPPAAPPWQPPDVIAPALNFEGTCVQQAHAAITHAQSEFRKHIEATDAGKGNFSPEGYQAQIAAFQNTAAARAVDTALESVTAHRDAAAAQVAKVKRDLSPNGDTAAELRANRYRDRVIRRLDVKDPGQLFNAANEELAGATREELGTLLQELPSYLQSRGVTTDWIDAAVAQVVPEFAAARAELKKAESAFLITRQNVGFVKQGFANGRPVTVLADPAEYA